MKHKTLLLTALILILFVVQQAQVGAETFPKTPVLSPLEAVVFGPPQTVSVTYYQLDPQSSAKVKDPKGNFHECFPKRNNNTGDKVYGCTHIPQDDTYYYPYSSNPYSDPIETDYLPNVLAHEMPATMYPYREAQAAQAVAARTLAYYKGYLLRNTYKFDNSAQFQVDVPYAFSHKLNETGTQLPEPSILCDQPGRNKPQQVVCDAIMNTWGIYLSPNGDTNHNPIDAEYGSDAGSHTDDAGAAAPYLLGVPEPNTTVSGPCAATRPPAYKGWGMSQKGAIRWIRANQCDLGGDLSTAWIVKWSEYRQVLAHYYTGIDLVDGSGALRPPNDRWNLLTFNNNSPIHMNPGAMNTYSLTVQNTSTTAWSANDIVLRYAWTPVHGTPTLGWDTADTIPFSAAPGKPVTVTLSVTAPTDPNVYELHLDVKHSNSLGGFYEGGWPDAVVSTGCVGQACATTEISQGSDDAGLDYSCTFDTARNEVYFGSCADGRNITSGFRFQNVTIPQTATIQSAYIEFSLDGPYTNPITITFQGELSTNALTYSASDPPTHTSRLNNLTGSIATWPIAGEWRLGQARRTPDLSPVIQEIVSQAGWTSGGPISIIVQNVTPGMTHRRVIGYERAFYTPNLYPAVLVVTYTP